MALLEPCAMGRAVPPARGAAAWQRGAVPAAHIEAVRHVLADRSRANLVAGGVVGGVRRAVASVTCAPTGVSATHLTGKFGRF